MDILENVEKYIVELFEKECPDTLIFHKINHTRDVVAAAKLIGQESNLSDEEMVIVQIAAWFHDTGYLRNYFNHEEESIKICKSFFASNSSDYSNVEDVIGCISATEIPQNPNNIIQEVLCDADMYHLSQEDFIEKTLLIRKELNLNKEPKLKKIEYYNSTLEFFSYHSYHTTFGNEVLSPGKEKNKNVLLELVDQKVKKGKKNEKVNKKIENNKTTARGIESMFRLTARNQISLSSIADNKANILITVNAIIISVIITMLVGKFNDFPVIIIPTLIFLLFSLLSIVFAILTTRPKLSSGKFTKEDIKNKNVNLMFFGNFYNMSLEEYEWAVKEMMNDYDGLYGNMIMDQYSLGKVLAKKYKRLRTAYNIFMIGMIVTVIVFSVTIAFYPL